MDATGCGDATETGVTTVAPGAMMLLARLVTGRRLKRAIRLSLSRIPSSAVMKTSRRGRFV